MTRGTLPPLAAAVVAALAACAVPEETPVVPGGGYEGTPPVGAAMALDPDGAWTWVPFQDTTCGDGSSTGLGVRKGTTSDLVVFFDGGGACWSYETCVAKTAFDRKFDEAMFQTEKAGYFPGSILDPQALPTSWRGANLVFVPYCTGDVHGGDRTTTYSLPLGLDEVTWHHRGHANVMAFLKRLKATFPSPARLLVAGSSAGGFATVASYEAFRWYWPAAKSYLVDDSGPTLVGSDLPSSFRSAWYASWNLGASLDGFCPECRDDLSAGFAAIAAAHPRDRIAFVSHVEDAVMTTFLVSTDFHADLDQLEAARFRASNTHVFYEWGTDHMLLTPLAPWTGTGTYVASHSTGGVTLDAWLARMLTDDAGWATVTPQ